MRAAPARVRGLLWAFVILVTLDVVLAHVDVFGRFAPATRPTGFFSGINYQVMEVVHGLHGRAAGPPPVLFLGNSQMEAAIRPLGPLGDRLVAAGAPPGTRAVSLCVFGTAPTDAEVITRELGAVHPGLVVLGLGAPDVGTPVERARDMPVTRLLDVGLRDGPVPPVDFEARLDRWVRTAWHLYRYRSLLRDLVLPPDERRTPAGYLDVFHPFAELLATDFTPDQVRTILALRPGFENAARFDDVVRYLDAFRGPDYLKGLRERWRTLTPAPVQLEALRRSVDQVRRAGGRPAWLLLPENPLLERDPEIGREVAARSDAIAASVRATAKDVGVPLIDLRSALPPSAFVDLNHLPTNDGRLMAPLTDALAARGLLAG